MPKKRPVRYLVAVKRANGRILWKWEPSKSLRDAGWKTVMLGENYAIAVARAEQLNAELDAWRLGAHSPSTLTGEGRGEGANRIGPANRYHATFADLVKAFRRDVLDNPQARDGQGYKASTRAEYESRLGWLLAWTEGGRTRLSLIDRDMVMDLRNRLVRTQSPYKASALLRVLSLLMSFAEQTKFIARGTDPTKRLKVPSPPRRKKAMAYESMHFLAETARMLNMERMALAVELGFLAIQRQADWRVMLRINWREMHDIDPADRAILCGPDGKVFGPRIRQGKTDTWVGCPVDHQTRLKVEARIAAMQARNFRYVLFFDGEGQDPDGLWHPRQFNKDWNAVKAAAIDRAIAEGDEWLKGQLQGSQYRDLRRSGMCWMRDMGATKEQIAARSGHSIEEVEDILETYMPANERGSGAAYARAFATAQQRSQERMER